jgi:phenylalanine-4-hydroxylase
MDHHLVTLDPDHPGFRDPIYRQRRDTIATIARDHTSGEPVPHAPYTEAEHGVWGMIRGQLDPLHDELVACDLLQAARALELPTDRIPQLDDVNLRLAGVDFRMEPVAGLVDARVFLEHLGRGVFLSTQYIRHASKPFYTPEPDVVHELIGHAASLLHPAVRATSRRFGQCAAIATDAEIERLTRVYWYTLEFGLAEEDGVPKAIGAGLLSSIGELERSVRQPDIVRRPLDLERVVATPYDPTTFQPHYEVGPGLVGTLSAIDAWLAAERWRLPSP